MSGPDLLVIGRLPPKVASALEARFTVHRLLDAADPDALIAQLAPTCRGIANTYGRRLDGAMMDRLPKLEIISNFGVGYDSIDAVAAGQRGIVVTNTPDVLSDEVADTTVGLLLMTVRELSAAERYLRAGKWTEKAYPLTRATMQNRRIGILGLGRIGKAIAKRLEGFNVSISYHNRRQASDVDYAYHPTPLALAEAVDTLIVVTPGGSDTQKLVGRDVLKALGPDGILINVARGSVVDQEALIAALRDGTILAAGLDVFVNEPQVPQELIELPNAVLLPHVASASEYTRGLMGQLMADNLIAWFDGKPPLTPVVETPVPATRKAG